MVRLVIALLLAFFVALPAKAQEDPIQGVISSQIEAFQRDDFATAFTFASPFIQRMFGSSERFGAMVRNGYPMVWRPADVTFSGQEQRGPFTYQVVRIRDAEGQFHYLEYEMLQGENSWQINGVQFIQAPELAA
ncbi:hypothetical protein AIOL_004023 [Candidatus Rhodobacter oscarellae]|uniref:DUF4864 domain-containing protein n=1 Tax=Candidatus Rhodobacter oscarellae TaxID=1675527 RepID=A0A0J9E8H1_9RHOB|nr:DUF4864 domain-containing protein [Candidatus Rhodobacter lobularis]KMW59042.1 hypothetical protein AIOL_004023 [Candidatus Rhodobacter lobularis]